MSLSSFEVVPLGVLSRQQESWLKRTASFGRVDSLSFIPWSVCYFCSPLVHLFPESSHILTSTAALAILLRVAKFILLCQSVTKTCSLTTSRLLVLPKAIVLISYELPSSVSIANEVILLLLFSILAWLCFPGLLNYLGSWVLCPVHCCCLLASRLLALTSLLPVFEKGLLQKLLRF